MEEERKGIFFKIIGILVLLQLSRILLKQQFFAFIPKTPFYDIIVSTLVMIIFTILIIMIAKKEDIEVLVFPLNHKCIYIFFSIIAIALLVSTPIITRDFSIVTIASLFFSSVVTPIYEEIIFRGLCWNMLKGKSYSDFKIFIITTILFSFWHFGYVDSIFFRTSTMNLPFVMIMKVATGLCYGIVLGLVRYTTKNNYSTILLHGVMNIFGR